MLLRSTPLVLALALSAYAVSAAAYETKVTPVAAADLPPAVVAVVTAAAPGLKITEAEFKEREDRRYYDVEGVLPDGAEIEFDLLETGGTWKIVETQRDIAWSATPQPVRDAAVKAVPEDRAGAGDRKHRGRRPGDLRAVRRGRPKEPSLEVSWKKGGPPAKVLTEAWPH